jgi:PAS domain S-box-containing protein
MMTDTAGAAASTPAAGGYLYLYRALAEHLPDVAVFLFDQDLRFKLATGAGLAKSAWRTEEIIGRTVQELFPPERAELLAVPYRAALAGERASFEVVGSRSQPDHVWAVDVVPMRGQDGAVTGGMAVARDVTEQRRAEQERRRLLARLYEVLEGQHQRLAADLHDSHLQSLAVLGLRLDQARLRLGSDQPETTGALLNQLRAEVAAEGAALRRTIGALRPLLLDQRGLAAAVAELAAATRDRAGLVACTVTDGLAGEQLDPGVETALFRVAQQALANVEQHAAARQVRVRLERSGPWVVLTVEDDGCGFDPSHVEVLPGHQGFGLTSMGERVQAIGGRLTVATRPGDGTHLEARVPAGTTP